MDENSRGILEGVLARFSNLRTVYQYRERLQNIWSRSASSHEHLLQAANLSGDGPGETGPSKGHWPARWPSTHKVFVFPSQVPTT